MTVDSKVTVKVTCFGFLKTYFAAESDKTTSRSPVVTAKKIHAEKMKKSWPTIMIAAQ